MSQLATMVTFLDLPVELRLQIAAYVLEQPRHAGLVWKGTTADVYKGFVPDTAYHSAPNLNLLLVCHSFRNDCSRLAYERTTFFPGSNVNEHICRCPPARLQDLRKLIVPFEPFEALIRQSPSNFFANDSLRLERLTVIHFDGWNAKTHTKVMVDFMRRVENIRSIIITLRDDNVVHKHRKQCCALVGAILKEDHFQRYDAQDAPKLEKTWWTWSYNHHLQTFNFTAQSAKTVMEEEAYMNDVAPLIQSLMDDLQSMDLPPAVLVEDG
ncbi:hypothetical protein IAQ61_007068 [Plenodomus lingam]|uniref:Predicted protein n=1 Tax=Leptosphaeria maculans (strain JN3 / isolate v23.1.3 / race Av1-4-5-6-7-8) TaxID=985895 RepID=E5A167_LEPMJ|nr:predicted protein [Plenodomus lingam JN3]KAH9867764.1 hypothetical protein IAQ61_007068 [Plenodomus lingam]CBX97523.1 predicted protein [Plenodomus lingam JN3]